jgi:hypothetical protein
MIIKHRLPVSTFSELSFSDAVDKKGASRP